MRAMMERAVVRTAALLGLSLSLAAASLLPGSSAHAQSFDPQFFHPAPAQRSNPAGIYSADTLPESSFELGVLGNYDSAPLVVRSATGDRLYDIIEHQATLHLMGAVGLFGVLGSAPTSPSSSRRPATSSRRSRPSTSMRRAQAPASATRG